MKKAVAGLLLLGAVCALFSVSTFADSRSTSAAVDFTPNPGTKPVSPVDPDRLEKELPTFPDQAGTVITGDSEGVPVGKPMPVQRIPGATGAAGWLAINYVTPLIFDKELADENGVFTVQQECPYLQTSDLRGTASGWKVTAIAGPFRDPADMSPVPALFSFTGGSAKSANSYLRSPVIPAKIELPANGNTQRLIEVAEEEEGIGIWVARWYPAHGAAQDFQLWLFSAASDGNLGFVVWIMNDAP